MAACRFSFNIPRGSPIACAHTLRRRLCARAAYDTAAYWDQHYAGRQEARSAISTAAPRACAHTLRRRLCARAAYDTAAYWDRHYAGRQDTFEWYFASSRALLRALGSHARGARCLEIGCGTSALGHALEAEGFDVQYCDFSTAAIDFWRRRLGPPAAARYHVADVRALPFARGAFAVGVDKGCLDALALGTDARQPTEQLARALDELGRVLQPGGTLYSFSTDPPELRLDLLRDAGGPGWRTSWRELDQDDRLAAVEPSAHQSARGDAREAAPYFMYVCRSVTVE